MKAIRFKCREGESGDLGWAPITVRNADPLGGLGVAHDYLEHFPGGDMGVADEFLAYGAMLWLRGAYITVRNGPGALGYDFPEILEHVRSENLLFPHIDTQPCIEGAEDHFRAIGAAAFQSCINQWEIDNDNVRSEVKLQVRMGVDYMRVGYRRAARRYARFDPEVLYWEIFKPIVENADTQLELAEEGDQLLVHATLKDLSTHVRLFPYKDSYGY